MIMPLLEVEGLRAGYGTAEVLFGIDLAVSEGEVVALLGRNGMGKTTTIRTIMGLVPARAGRISLKGRDMTGEPPYRMAQAGVGLVPEGRQVFPTLTVVENLVATQRPASPSTPGWTLERVLDFFPALARRTGNYGNQLSGGEQQMLAIGRALLTNPRLLVLDEATEGLAPLIRQEIWNRLAILKREGMSILLIDKNLRDILRLADRLAIIEKGHIVWRGTPSELKADRAARDRYLSV
jgi:branched-chain amino acid transport system ATP-binding protein